MVTSNSIYIICTHCLQMISTDQAKTDLFESSKADASSTKAAQLQRTTSNCLIKTCERTGIFQSEEEVCKRMTCSRIYFSVITELISPGEDSLDNIAFFFGKHSKEVCKKCKVLVHQRSSQAQLEVSPNVYHRQKKAAEF